MADYALSREGDRDVRRIVLYSASRWGFARAQTYVLGLHDAFRRLASYPHLGRRADDLREGYLRYEHGSHTVFYKRIEHGVLIIRVLYKSMDVKRHL